MNVLKKRKKQQNIIIKNRILTATLSFSRPASLFLLVLFFHCSFSFIFTKGPLNFFFLTTKKKSREEEEEGEQQICIKNRKKERALFSLCAILT